MSLEPGSLDRLVPDHVDNLVLLSCIRSTHDMAVGLLEEAQDDEIDLPPTLIVAESQTAGHGRSGRPWISPAGGLYLSVVRGDLDSGLVPLLPMLTAAVACDALDDAGVPVRIKWPNDLVVGDRKIGGTLFHTRRGEATWCVVSLGLNVRATPELPPGLRATATSVAEQLPPDTPLPDPSHLAVSFVAGLSRAVDAPGEAVTSWRDLLVHREGDPMEVHLEDGSTVSGTFAGTTEQGLLRLRTVGGERILATGDVGLGG